MLADDHMVRAGDAQVTTRAVDMARCMAVDKDSRGSCILLNFYLKPQPETFSTTRSSCCILLNFYIKPQPTGCVRIDFMAFMPGFPTEKNGFELRGSRFDVFFSYFKEQI